MTSNEVVLHPVYGPALPGLNWVPAPSYLLRRHRVLHLLRDVPPCRVLDIGCGPGALLRDLAERGFRGVGLDRSAQALSLAKHLHPEDGPISIHAAPGEDWTGAFDLVCAFEVLEHIEDDVGALREWREMLAPGGRLMVSSPAHPEMWSKNDEWAGHVRRYERHELIEKLQAAGFIVDRIECYGFPLANLVQRVRAWAYGRQLREKTQAGLDVSALTDESGSDRRIERRIWPVFASWPIVLVMAAFCHLQRPFLRTDLGPGYIALARLA